MVFFGGEGRCFVIHLFGDRVQNCQILIISFQPMGKKITVHLSASSNELMALSSLLLCLRTDRKHAAFMKSTKDNILLFVR